MKTIPALLLLAALIGCDEDKDTGDTSTDDTGTTTDTADTGDTEDSGGSGEIVSMVVGNAMLLCSAEGQWLCPEVQIEDGDWGKLWCGVNNLDYVWGTTYTLTAQKVGYSDPAGDGCGDVYDLVEVQTETFDGAGRAFEYNWVYDTMIEPGFDGGGTIMGTPFVCADTAVCDVAEVTGSDWTTTYTVSLQNPMKAGDPLVLVALTLE